MGVTRNDIPGGAFNYLHPLRILLTVAAVKSFLKRLAGGRRSFRDLGMGDTAAPDLSGECGGGKTPP